MSRSLEPLSAEGAFGKVRCSCSTFLFKIRYDDEGGGRWLSPRPELGLMLSRTAQIDSPPLRTFDRSTIFLLTRALDQRADLRRLSISS